MRDLAHQRRAVLMNALGELLQIRDDRVGADIELAEDVGRIRGHIGRPAEHRERDTAPGLALVIELVTLRRHSVDFQPAGVAGAHDAVL